MKIPTRSTSSIHVSILALSLILSGCGKLGFLSKDAASDALANSSQASTSNQGAFYQISPALITVASVTPTLSIPVQMSAVPLDSPFYAVCVSLVDSIGRSVLLKLDCNNPPLRSDVAAGDETVNVVANPPSAIPVGQYTIVVSYQKWTDQGWVRAPMNKGPGVTNSPEIGATPYQYAIGVLNVGTNLPAPVMMPMPSPTPSPTMTMMPMASPAPSPAPSPTMTMMPMASPSPVGALDLTITSPAANTQVMGNVVIRGMAGSSLVNLAAYTAGGTKLSTDVAPMNGQYSVSVDTSQLPDGSQTIWVIAFTVAPGQAGGTKVVATINLNVNNHGGASSGGGAPAPSNGSAVQAQSASTFMSSLGVNIHAAQGVPVSSYVAPLQYLGVRNIRDDRSDANGVIQLHQQTGVLKNLIANADVTGSLNEARAIANGGALLSIEGANEPNNFPQNYNGQTGGGSNSWVPIAQMQRDIYSQVKSDAVLNSYPVFGVSEGGGQTDNVGLQFLTIPAGAGTVMPDGTKYSDYANVHNYVSGRGVLVDNMAWGASDPTLNDQWDALYVEYGRTWLKGFAGYSNAQLPTVPRVTTETGWDTGDGNETRQGTLLLNTYMGQFKRGYRYTFIYQIRDGEGGGGNQGIFHADSSPKLAATYIHNMTTILQDNAESPKAQLTYSMTGTSATVHDLLLQKSNGAFELVVWNERISGSDNVTITFDHSFATVNVYDPTVGTSVIRSTSGASITVSLSDHPMIIELK